MVINALMIGFVVLTLVGIALSGLIFLMNLIFRFCNKSVQK